jgi:putative transposase
LEPIWLGDDLPKVLKFRHARCERPTLLTSKTDERVNAFKSATSAQRFVSLHAAVYNTFNIQRHLIRRPTHRQFRTEAQSVWSDATAAAA